MGTNGSDGQLWSQVQRGIQVCLLALTMDKSQQCPQPVFSSVNWIKDKQKKWAKGHPGVLFPSHVLVQLTIVTHSNFATPVPTPLSSLSSAESSGSSYPAQNPFYPHTSLTHILLSSRDILRVGVTLAGHQKKILNSIQVMRAQMNQIQSVEV
jgi:hypothetical protein